MAIQRAGQGGTIRLDAEFRDGTGRLEDPTTPLIDVLTPSGIAAITDGTPVRVGQGLYYFDYTVPTTAPLGLWRVNWTGVLNGVAVNGEDFFEVVTAGTVGFGFKEIVTIRDIEEWLQRSLDAEEEARVRLLARTAQAQIEAYLNRPVTVREFEETHLCNANGDVFVNNTPVQSILEVAEVGTSVWPLVAGNWVGRPWGASVRVWTLEGRYVPGLYRIRYRGGYDSPEWASTMVLGAIGGALTRSAEGEDSLRGVKVVRVEDYEVQYDARVVAGGGEAEGALSLINIPSLKTLARYKRRAAG